MLFTVRSESNHGQTFENEGATEMKIEGYNKFNQFKTIESAKKHGVEVSEPQTEICTFGVREYQVLETLKDTFQGDKNQMTNTLAYAASARLRLTLGVLSRNGEMPFMRLEHDLDLALKTINRISLINGGFDYE